MALSKSCNPDGLEKTGMMGLPGQEKFDIFRGLAVNTRVWRTDRQKHDVGIASPGTNH